MYYVSRIIAVQIQFSGRFQWRTISFCFNFSSSMRLHECILMVQIHEIYLTLNCTNEIK